MYLFIYNVYAQSNLKYLHTPFIVMLLYNIHFKLTFLKHKFNIYVLDISMESFS